MAIETSTVEQLLAEHIERFNAGVRAGDFDAMVDAMADDAHLEFEGVPVGPFEGREAIRAAYREQPVDEQIELLSTTVVDAGTAVGHFRWLRSGGTGTMTVGQRDGRIARMVVAFDAPTVGGGVATEGGESHVAPDAAPTEHPIGKPTLDPHALRADFPILRRVIHGRPLVYLDSASSSQKPQVVIDAMTEYYEQHNANVHRGIYTIAEEATAAHEGARVKLARFINAPDSHEVVFARNATEAINLVAYSWGRKHIGRGDQIILTEMEHHANLVPWQLLVQEVDGDMEFIPITDDGVLRLDVFEVLLRLKPKLVAFTHVSNTLGTINPVREMVDMAHAAGALVLVDGAQAVPHVPVDVQALGCDFYAFSGHKMLGPMGSGALWARRELLEAMPPFLSGGDMIREVHLRRSEFNEIPWKFEAGTPAVGDSVGIGVAAEYLQGIGMDAVREHERGLVAYALDVLARDVPDIELYGPTDPDIRGGVVPFNLPGIHPHDVAQVLDRSGIAIRAGHHCTMPLHERLDLAATARASFSVYTTTDDIDALAAGLREVQRVFNG
jgi:cysteine desulfurase/selenocysteine lyase